MTSENDARNKEKMLRKICKSNKLFKSVLGKMPHSLIFHPRKNPLLFSLTGDFKGKQRGTALDATLLVARRGPIRRKKQLISRRKKQEGKESERLN